MTDLFAPAPTDNLLPYNGFLNDLGRVIDYDKVLYEALLKELSWQSDKVTLFGKTHITTRKIVWMGGSIDEGRSKNESTSPLDSNGSLAYSYSGHTRPIIAWHDSVLQIKQLIERKLAEIGVEANFNTCLLNYYPSGQEGMGYHADDEPELGERPIIASLSLGATRKFVLKHKTTKQNVELMLESGQLIVMHGDTQRYWKHTVTKTKRVSDGRISLTFRKMLK